MSESSWTHHGVRCHGAVLILAGLLMGAGDVPLPPFGPPVRFARLPIEHSDGEIAQALAGQWQRVPIFPLSFLFEAEPPSTLIIKSLPEGRSLVQWIGPKHSSPATAVVSWTKHKGYYLAIANGFLISSDAEGTKSTGIGSVVYLIKVRDEGNAFRIIAQSLLPVMPGWGIRELRSSLEKYGVNYRTEPGRLVIDDSPEAMLRWVRAMIDDARARGHGGGTLVVYHRVAKATERNHPHANAPHHCPVVAPKPD